MPISDHSAVVVRGPAEASISSTTLSAYWAGASVATVAAPHLHCPTAISKIPRNNNPCCAAKSSFAIHAVEVDLNPQPSPQKELAHATCYLNS